MPKKAAFFYRPGEKFGLKTIQAREAAEAEQQKANKAHGKAIEPKLQALDSLIAQERWSTNSDAGFREQLRQARLTLLEATHDPKDVQERFAKIDEFTRERDILQEAGFQKEEQALREKRERSSQQRILLTDPEPQKSEHEPDPHGFDDPMAGHQPESEPEVELPKASIDTSKNLKQQIADLHYESLMQSFPLPVLQEIAAAEDVLKETGNQVPAMEVLTKYVE